MYEINLDSSIIISILIDDVHANNVIKALHKLMDIKSRIYISLITYSELWTGIELINDNKIRRKSIINLNYILNSISAKIVSDNLVIAQRAAKAQAEYRKRGGKRKILIPDFLIGANSAFYSKRLLTTNPRDFMKYFPKVEILTPEKLIRQNLV